MNGRNLAQAIARVNWVHKDKSRCQVVDYLGIAADLKEALSFYSDAGGTDDPAEAQEKAVELMLEKLEVVEQLFFGYPYENYFTVDTAGKLRIILGLDDGKKRLINEVSALSKR